MNKLAHFTPQKSNAKSYQKCEECLPVWFFIVLFSYLLIHLCINYVDT